MTKSINFVFFLIFSLLLFKAEAKDALIMINPAGDASNLGRRLVESYERSITFKMSESLCKNLQERYNIKTVLTRSPGEKIVDLQNASFANRLGVDLYLSLHIYRQESIKPKFYIYYFVDNPISDNMDRSFDPCKLIPIRKAHLPNIKTTKTYANKMKNFLTKEKYQKNFDCFGSYGIPLKPLVGVVAPALCIEIGICDQDQWKNLIKPIIKSLSFLDGNKND